MYMLLFINAVTYISDDYKVVFYCFYSSDVCNEKLAMITGRARKTYDAQVLAHFGVKVPHDPKHDIAFIGQDTYDLKVGEVTSLSSTSEAGLGDLAGKGLGSGQSKGHKFTAPCHGIVMTIFSIEPKKRYFGEYNRINALYL